METAIFSRVDRSPLGQWWWTVDRTTLFAFLSLAVIGVLMVATASPPVAERIGLDSFYFLTRHLIFIVPSVAVMVGVSVLSPRWLWRLSSLAFPAIILALIAVLIFGAEIKGARRWLPIAGMSVQPSEFLKPIFALVAAWFLARTKKHGNLKAAAVAMALYAVCAALLMMQPDFGMTFVLTAIWCVQVFLAGLPLRYVFGLLLALAVGVMIVYASFDHVQSRIDRFLNPDSGDNYQVEQSLEAFRAGGILGAGPGQGSVKLRLPDAHADFTFAVLGEEMGVIAVVCVIGLFLFVILRSLARLMEDDDIFCVLGAGGLLSMLGLQAFVHMGSALNVLPAKGMTLPFISYGGSSTLAIGFTMGAILCLTRRKTR